MFVLDLCFQAGGLVAACVHLPKRLMTQGWRAFLFFRSFDYACGTEEDEPLNMRLKGGMIKLTASLCGVVASHILRYHFLGITATTSDSTSSWNM